MTENIAVENVLSESVLALADVTNLTVDIASVLNQRTPKTHTIRGKLMYRLLLFCGIVVLITHGAYLS